jgi:WD40 repeat protein
MRAGFVFALTIGVVGALAASQPGAGRTSAHAMPQVRTVATVRGHVLDFAQDGRYLAWLLAGPGQVGRVFVEDLRTGARTSLPRTPGATGDISMDPRGLALLGGRAYWEQTYTSANTTDASLATASIQDPRLRGIGYEEIANPSSYSLQPPVSDGRGVYFWSGREDDFFGPVIRFEGLSRSRVTGRLPTPAALAAGGGRFAVAVRDRDDAAGSPAWSPDGKQIAFTRKVGSSDELWLANANGVNEHMIAVHGSDPDWSPDGTKLAYGGPNNTVVIGNADGSNPQVVTTGSDPAWSPDGRQLAVVVKGSIWTVGSDGRGSTLVIPDGYDPDWSPDGRELVYAGGQFGDEVWLANDDASNQHMLASGGAFDPSPTWSPDGSEIAWASHDCGDTDSAGICEIHPDGTDRRGLEDGTGYPLVGYEPAWAPTSKSLVYVSEDEDGDSHIAVWPGLRQLTVAPPEMSIVVRASAGRRLADFESSGRVDALAVSRRVVAALISDAGRLAIEIYQPTRHVVPLAGSPKGQLAISGTTLVFQIGHTIEALDAVAGSPHPVAHSASYAIGLSIVGRRVAWAENGHRGARIRELELP